MKVRPLGWGGFLLFVIPALKVYAIQQISFLDNLFDAWSILSCLSLVLITLKRQKNIIFRYIVTFVLIYLVSTALNYPDQIMGAISEISRLLIVPLYMLLIKHEQNIKTFLIKLRKSFIVILCLDVLSGILQLMGFTLIESRQITFLGLDNYAAFIIVPMLTVVFFTSYVGSGHIRKLDIAIYFLVLIQKVLTNSLAAMIAMLIFGVMLYIGFHWDNLRAIVTPKKIMVSIIILLIMIVGFGVQNYFEPILTSLGRDATLSYRTVIWDKVIKSIPDALLLGYGKTSGDEFKTIVGFSLLYDTQANHPHSFYLSVLFSTGILGSVVFLRMFFLVFRAIYRNKKLKDIYILSCGLISFFMIAFADDYIMLPYLYMIICISYFYAVKRQSIRSQTENSRKFC